MDHKITGAVYIIIALLIIVVKYGIPQFFDYLIWIIAIVLLIAGIYMLFIKKY